MALDHIREIIAEHMGYEEVEEVVPDMSLSDDLMMDEEGLRELLSSIEEEFSIEISDEDMEEFEFVHDIISYVSQAL